MSNNYDIHSKASHLTTHLLTGFRELIDNAGIEKCAVLYSGGLDSAVVSMLSRMTVGRNNSTLHTFGTETSRDRINAREGVPFLDIDWEDHLLSEEEILRGANSLLEIVHDLNFLELSYELPLFMGASTIADEVIITGQGADELFGGYARYRETDDPLAQRLMLDRDRVKLFTRTKKIERGITLRFDKILVTPFLHDSVITFSSSLKLDDLFDGFGGNKMVLRESGRILGLPEMMCSRPKLAAQYGSGISKVLKKLRKRELLNLAETGEKHLSV